ncbi:MAG TPA: hypothetical protein VGO63_00435 [Candidatus Paceibacterota bacterium]|jgi:hypothetical protein|nr:hypothetical protein [Candidatus Paceibacterota bacterium]
MKNKLFPKYLPEGSSGDAVLFLQLMIIAQEGKPSLVIADGDYTIGGKTGDYVAALQGRHNIEQDRNFGPQTRVAFYAETGIDVNKIETDGNTVTIAEQPNVQGTYGGQLGQA